MLTSLRIAALLGSLVFLYGCGAAVPESVGAAEAQSNFNPYPPGAETPTLWSSAQWMQHDKTRK